MRRLLTLRLVAGGAIAAASMLSLTAALAQTRSVDWEACASAIESLRDDADTAHTDAEDAAEEQEKLQKCRRDSSVDRYADQCQTQASRFRRSANAAAASADSVVGAAREVESACVPMTVQERLAASERRLCLILRRHAALSQAQARASCEKSKGKSWCDVCLK